MCRQNPSETNFLCPVEPRAPHASFPYGGNREAPPEPILVPIPTFVFSENAYNEEFHQMFGVVGAGQIQWWNVMMLSQRLSVSRPSFGKISGDVDGNNMTGLVRTNAETPLRRTCGAINSDNHLRFLQIEHTEAQVSDLAFSGSGRGVLSFCKGWSVWSLTQLPLWTSSPYQKRAPRNKTFPNIGQSHVQQWW